MGTEEKVPFEIPIKKFRPTKGSDIKVTVEITQMTEFKRRCLVFLGAVQITLIVALVISLVYGQDEAWMIKSIGCVVATGAIWLLVRFTPE